MTVNKQLSVRFDPETREKLELVANREHRPIANQVVHFVVQSLDSYMEKYGLYFKQTDDGLTIEAYPPDFTQHDVVF